MIKSNSPSIKNIPLDIVQGSTFGRDPKIMSSRTFNMLIEDEWIIGNFGYSPVLEISKSEKSRGIFSSIRLGKLIVVIANNVYLVSQFDFGDSIGTKVKYVYQKVGTIDSFSGDVFIDENNVGQIGICDQHNVYIYDNKNSSFVQAVLPEGFNPGYITYQNGRFIAPDTKTASWALSAVGNGLNWNWGASGEPVLGAIQTKPDLAQAVLRVPGRGNLLFVFGKTVTELWTDVGSPSFPYQRSTSINLDYGCANAATIGSSDNMVAWLGTNEKSGPVIMYTTGGDIQQLSSNGINNILSKIKYPNKSVGFFMKISGHLIYQLTFYDKEDNFSIAYDFTSNNFLDVTDEKMDYHVIRRVAFLNNKYYFVSLNDGSLYQIDPESNVYDYGSFGNWEIPRVRVCSNLRIPNNFRFAINNVTLNIEQGNDILNDGNLKNYNPRIDLSLSQNGGISFSSGITKPIYRSANRLNKLDWWGLGSGNDIVLQFRFYSKGPLRISNGLAGIYQ